MTICPACTRPEFNPPPPILACTRSGFNPPPPCIPKTKPKGREEVYLFNSER